MLQWIRELTLRYTTPDIRCRHRRHECDDGIKMQRLKLHWFDLLWICCTESYTRRCPFTHFYEHVYSSTRQKDRQRYKLYTRA